MSQHRALSPPTPRSCKAAGKSPLAQLVKGGTFPHTRYRQAHAAKELGTQIPSGGVGDPQETERWHVKYLKLASGAGDQQGKRAGAQGDRTLQRAKPAGTGEFSDSEWVVGGICWS